MNNRKLKQYIKNEAKQQRVFFWGASNYLKSFLTSVNYKAGKVIGIIDRDETKKGEIFCGYKIFSQKEIETLAPELIIVSANNYPQLPQEIISFLDSKNIKCEVKTLTDIADLQISLSLNPFKLLFKSNSQKLKFIIDSANSVYAYNATIPSMLRKDEKRLLHLLAKYYYSGQGAIFDAGIFLGGCTEAFCNGLAENKRIKPNKQLWAYEYGLCAPELNKKSSSNYTFSYLKKCYPDKEISYDFSKIVQENLESLNKSEYYNLYLGDVNKAPYPEKIEIMFLDLCKCQQTNFQMQQLFERLIPKKSIVIQQDYIYGICPWIKVTMGYLKDYFEFVGSTPLNSAVFLLKKKIPPEMLKVNPYAILNYSEAEKMHNYHNKYLNKKQEEYVLKSLKIMEEDKYAKV